MSESNAQADNIEVVAFCEGLGSVITAARQGAKRSPKLLKDIENLANKERLLQKELTKELADSLEKAWEIYRDDVGNMSNEREEKHYQEWKDTATSQLLENLEVIHSRRRGCIKELNQIRRGKEATERRLQEVEMARDRLNEQFDSWVSLSVVRKDQP